MEWLAQAIGFLGFLFIVLAFQLPKRKNILWLLLAGHLSFVAHYSMLAAWTAVAMNIIGAARAAVFTQRDSKHGSRIWPGIFILLFILGGIVAWEGRLTLLPVIAMVIETVIFWLHSPRLIRLFSLVPRPLWFSYSFIVGSYAGMATDMFLFASILLAIYRFDIRKA